MSMTKEPLFHITRRGNPSLLRNVLVRLAAVVLSLVVCGIIIIALTGMNPIAVYVSLWDGALGTNRRIWLTLQNTAILLCVSFAVLPAFRMRFWNIGAEGQVLIGAWATAAVMIYGSNSLPAWAVYALCPVAAIAAGMLWGVIPAYFKARWNTNETLFTLMLNYIATQIVTLFIVLWENPKGSNHVGLINSNTRLGWLPVIGGNNSMLVVLIVAGITLLLFVYMNYTKQGYEIAVVGESENTARYATINVKRVLIRTMAISGALAGIAGYLLTSGIGHTISAGLAGGRGFTAITVAWLGKLNPFIMMFVSLFLTFIERGSSQIATVYKLSESASEILTGIILFFVLGCEFFINYRVEFRHSHKEVKA